MNNSNSSLIAVTGSIVQGLASNSIDKHTNAAFDEVIGLIISFSSMLRSGFEMKIQIRLVRVLVRILTFSCQCKFCSGYKEQLFGLPVIYELGAIILYCQ